MSHRYRRTDRVDELLKEEIASILRDLRDPRVGFVTVMDVKTSPDLRHAQVYVSVLGDEDAKADTMAALDSAAGYVRGRVAQAITLKYLPSFQFHLDRTVARAARIETLIREMRADVGELTESEDEDEDGERPADEEAREGGGPAADDEPDEEAGA